jgi:hypothetical protein
MGVALYWLSDAEWAKIEPLMPRGRRGAHRVDDRRVLNGIFWVLLTGAPWRFAKGVRAAHDLLQPLCPLAQSRSLEPHGQAGDCPVAAHLLGHLRPDTTVLTDRRTTPAGCAARSRPPVPRPTFRRGGAAAGSPASAR